MSDNLAEMTSEVTVWDAKMEYRVVVVNDNLSLHWYFF